MKEYYVEGTSVSLAEHGMDFFLQRSNPGCIATNDHIHEQLEFIYINEGEFKAFVNDGEYLLQKGDVLFVRSNAVHRVFALNAPALSYYVLKLKVSVIFELANERNAADYVLRLVLDRGGERVCWKSEEADTAPIAEAFERLKQEYHSQSVCRDMSMKLWAYSAVLNTLKSLVKNDSSAGAENDANGNLTSQIYKVIKHINRHYAEPIDAEDCARRANMSYSYFSRSFKRITGRSFKEYLNFVRVSHAEQLIYSGNKGITEIAMECGYNNVSYFISVYKRLKGQTPLKLRKKEQN